MEAQCILNALAKIQFIFQNVLLSLAGQQERMKPLEAATCEEFREARALPSSGFTPSPGCFLTLKDDDT